MAAVPLTESAPLEEVADAATDREAPPPPSGPPSPAAAPVATPRRAAGPPHLRARKVQRVIRRVEPWSVLKLSAVFYVCLWLVVTVAGVILWRVAEATGTITNVESFFAELSSSESFTIDGGQILRASAIAGLVLVFAGTALTMLLTILFNLISELTGGIRLAVVELETAERVTGRSRWWSSMASATKARVNGDADVPGDEEAAAAG
jgi:hypothetical protein